MKKKRQTAKVNSCERDFGGKEAPGKKMELDGKDEEDKWQ